MDTVVSTSLRNAPNMMTACKEITRKSICKIEHAAIANLKNWTRQISLHTSTLLSSLQSKYDYAPKNTIRHSVSGRLGSIFSANSTKTQETRIEKSSISRTIACGQVYESLSSVCLYVDKIQRKLLPQDFDLMENFWKPLGEEWIGNLVTHIRKQKVNEIGVHILLRDLEDYLRISYSMERPETLDMMSCFREICSKIFTSSATNLYKIICEDLYYIDTDIVLTLCRARSDYSASTPWVKEICRTFPNLIDEAMKLPWEVNAPSSLTGPNDMLLSKYPSTLRKPSAPLSQLRTEQLRQRLQSPLSLLSISQEKQFVGSNTKSYFVDNMLTATSGYISTAYSSQTNTTLTASSLTNKAADKVDRENTKSENCVF